MQVSVDFPTDRMLWHGTQAEISRGPIIVITFVNPLFGIMGQGKLHSFNKFITFKSGSLEKNLGFFFCNFLSNIKCISRVLLKH